MLPKWKNIAKTIEYCSKACFSHIRNKVKKVTLKPFILERFLEQKSTQDREKVVSKSLLKYMRFLIRFFINFSSILAPLGDPKVLHFSFIFALVVALAPSWRQEGPQSAPRQPRRSILSNFLPFWIRFWMHFRCFSISILDEFRHRFCFRCFVFICFFNF